MEKATLGTKITLTFGIIILSLIAINSYTPERIVSGQLYTNTGVSVNNTAAGTYYTVIGLSE